MLRLKYGETFNKMIYDITIIGAGPGGYIAALKAAQYGANVALIEKKDLGGTCLNKGCIPTKSILASVKCLEHTKNTKSFGIEVSDIKFNFEEVYNRQINIVKQMRKGIEQLIKSYSNITLFKGEAEIISPETLLVHSNEEIEIKTKNIIIASGSKPASLGAIKPDHKTVINSDDALNLTELPKNIVIIGGGAIGIEWARIFSAFGTEVTVVEALEKLLPSCDDDISNLVVKLFKKNKVKSLVGIKVSNIDITENQALITLDNGETISCEKVLLATGRIPDTDIKGLSNLNIEKNHRFIKVNDFMQTNIPNIYAIGDVIGTLQLAHVASAEGIVAVKNILNKNPKPVNYNCVPFCVYGEPEIAMAGLTETQAKNSNTEIDISKHHYAANGKAIAESKSTGFVKVISEIKTGRILGVHIIGENASDMIHNGVLAMQNNITANDFENTIFAHPTLSETFYECMVKLHTPKKVAIHS